MLNHKFANVDTYVFRFVRMYVCMCLYYVCMHMYMYIRVYACTYIHMHVCTVYVYSVTKSAFGVKQ